jgi:alkylation response protein AidB-like acyl-CoA dehydrogenase
LSAGHPKTDLEFEQTEEQRLLLEQVDRVCKEVRPAEDRCYLRHQLNPEVRTAFAGAHLLGLPISRDYGDGQGADMVTYATALERIGREGTGVRTFFSGHTSLGMLTIQKWGTDEQKERYLTPGTKGEKVFAFGLTEPGAGSDPSSLTTNFEEKDGGYALNGQKMWISNGTIADAVVIFAYPKGKGEGMCAFIVEKDSRGFSSRPIENKMGLFSSDTGTIYLEDCHVPKSSLLGRQGKGLSVAYSALMSGRLSVAAGCVGVMQDCLDEAIRYSSTRVQHGKPIAKHQLVQRHIAKMSVNTQAARLLTLMAARAHQTHLDRPGDESMRNSADVATAQAKYFAARASFDAANRAVQVFGANGYSIENRPARHLLDTRVCQIYEGTNEILEQKIAVSLLGRGFEAYS